MLPRAGIDQKTDQKVFLSFFCTITEFSQELSNIIIFIEVLRFCSFLRIFPETFIKFSSENWTRTFRYRFDSWRLAVSKCGSAGPGNGGQGRSINLGVGLHPPKGK